MKRETVVIHTPQIKLDQLLKFCGACISGGQAKEIISDGLVLVDDEICFVRGKKLKSGNKVTLNLEDKMEFLIKYETD